MITMHYTGMRWGEATGLEASCVKPGSIRIWWQLAGVNGLSVKIPPKYGNRRGGGGRRARPAGAAPGPGKDPGTRCPHAS